MEDELLLNLGRQPKGRQHAAAEVCGEVVPALLYGAPGKGRSRAWGR
jgi:hypothetical protein